MNKFVNRSQELRALRKAFEQPEGGLYVLYGRRRLGKTTLLKEFSRNLPGVYHLADRTSETDARRFLAESMARGLQEPVLAAECKHTRQPLSIGVACQLQSKVHCLWPQRSHAIRLALFSTRGFTRDLKIWSQENRVTLFDAGDLTNDR